MRYKLKYYILKIQEYATYFTRSKVFLYGVFVILLGIVVAAFSVKTKKTVTYDFYTNDIIETRAAERIVTEEMDISMSEINRISKLLTFFFNDIIVNKSYEIAGISEYYTDITSYDMQILDVSKAGKTYEALIIIATPNDSFEELVYTPYKQYEIIINSTDTGLKVDYINIIHEEVRK